MQSTFSHPYKSKCAHTEITNEHIGWVAIIFSLTTRLLSVSDIMSSLEVCLLRILFEYTHTHLSCFTNLWVKYYAPFFGSWFCFRHLLFFPYTVSLQRCNICSSVPAFKCWCQAVWQYSVDFPLHSLLDGDVMWDQFVFLLVCFPISLVYFQHALSELSFSAGPFCILLLSFYWKSGQLQGI